ncbi:MAG: hypothetical protein L0H75_10760 [Nitrosospira sp.]|nr:hypothetical protein [Nitrosospira sp.]
MGLDFSGGAAQKPGLKRYDHERFLRCVIAAAVTEACSRQEPEPRVVL